MLSHSPKVSPAIGSIFISICADCFFFERLCDGKIKCKLKVLLEKALAALIKYPAQTKSGLRSELIAPHRSSEMQKSETHMKADKKKTLKAEVKDG